MKSNAVTHRVLLQSKATYIYCSACSWYHSRSKQELGRYMVVSLLERSNRSEVRPVDLTKAP